MASPNDEGASIKNNTEIVIKETDNLQADDDEAQKAQGSHDLEKVQVSSIPDTETPETVPQSPEPKKSDDNEAQKTQGSKDPEKVAVYVSSFPDTNTPKTVPQSPEAKNSDDDEAQKAQGSEGLENVPVQMSSFPDTDTPKIVSQSQEANQRQPNRISRERKSSEDLLGVQVPYLQLYRYGTWIEVLATLVGVILGLASGFGMPLTLTFVGEMTTSFLERTTNVPKTSYLPYLSAFGGGIRLENASPSEQIDAMMEDAKALMFATTTATVFGIFLCFLSMLIINWSAIRQITRIRRLFFESVLRQDMGWYDTETSFNLASKISDDMVKLRDGIGEKLGIIANLIGTSIGCIIISFPLGWQLTLACLSVMPFSIATSIALTHYQTKSSVKELKSYSQAGKLAEEILKSVRTVVAFGGEQKEITRYGQLLEPAEQYGRRRGLYMGLGLGFNWVLTYSLNAIGLLYGTRLVLDDMDKPVDDRTYHAGVIMSIFFMILMATQSITFCLPHSDAFSNAKAAAVVIFELIERHPRINSLSEEGVRPSSIKGEIAFQNVTFNYPARPGVKVLKGFSLKVRAGESVALVGSSGCGKSTVLQLVQRLYDPSSGDVRLDGQDISTLNLGWLRSHIGVVGQEPVLFRGTVFENIAMGMPNTTREEVQRVAEQAFAHDFIKKMPRGYDTVIGERGASLSGGQKQRIAIARSLLREPVVLLLDEATSALDPHSERQVQAALDRAAVGRTTLTVSHRLATIRNADRIIYMDQGVIIEEGNYDELLDKKGHFWKLATAGKEHEVQDNLKAVSDDKVGEDTFEKPKIEFAEQPRRGSSIMLSSTLREREKERMLICPRPSCVSSFSPDHETLFVDDYDGEGPKPVSDWEILKLNAPEWPTMVVGIISSFLHGATFPSFAVLLGFGMGIFALKDHAEILRLSAMYSGLYLAVAAIAGITMCFQGTAFTRAGLRMTTRLRMQYFTSLLSQEIGYYDRETNTVGALCARLSGDTAEVQGATGLRIGMMLQGVSSVVVGCVMGLFFQWKLTLVGVAFLPLMLGSFWIEGIASEKSQSVERKAMEKASSIATEAVVSIRTVQSLSLEKVFLQNFNGCIESAIKAISKKTRWRGLIYGLGIYIPLFIYAAVTGYGAILIANEGLQYSVILLVNEAVMYGAYMLGQSLVYSTNFATAKNCAARIISTINRVPKVKTEDGVVDMPNWTATGEVNYKELEFSYPSRPNQQILRGISLKIEAGKTIALVGPSGCGKSTLLQLLQRFYDPDDGVIELDGYDTRRALTLPRLRQQLGVVQQEPVLFERTLAENIAYGDNTRKVTMEEIMEAARAANIHSFIVSLPKGYETHVGSGTQLSGGQKQRVCIARALVRAPRLLLLDEATSALDAGSERQVAEALLTAARGRTCATIAHRLSTVRHADLICVLDKGVIVESGSHDELMLLQGHYWKLSQDQMEIHN